MLSHRPSQAAQSTQISRAMAAAQRPRPASCERLNFQCTRSRFIATLYWSVPATSTHSWLRPNCPGAYTNCYCISDVMRRFMIVWFLARNSKFKKIEWADATEAGQLRRPLLRGIPRTLQASLSFGDCERAHQQVISKRGDATRLDVVDGGRKFYLFITKKKSVYFSRRMTKVRVEKEWKKRDTESIKQVPSFPSVLLLLLFFCFCYS